MKNLILMSSFALFSSSVFAAECTDETPFLEVFICQGHSLLKMNVPESNKLVIHFRGFYPEGRVVDEIGSRLYTLDDLALCQSVCKTLTSEQALDLKHFIRDTIVALDRHRGEISQTLNRTTVYDAVKFNCVDFSQMVFSRYSNHSIAEAFAAENKPLAIYSDALEPCFGSRNPQDCLQWGIDKAAFWVHYRDGLPNLLSQIYLREKPLLLLVNGILVSGCIYKNSAKLLLVIGSGTALFAVGSALINYKRLEQVSPTESAFPQLILSGAEVLAGIFQVAFQRVVPEDYRRFSYLLHPVVFSCLLAYIDNQRDDITAAIESFR